MCVCVCVCVGGGGGGGGSKLTNVLVHCRCVNKNAFHSIRDVQKYQNQNGFRSHECMWIPSERLKPVFHQVFIWHLIKKGDSHPGDEHSSPIWKLCIRRNH